VDSDHPTVATQSTLRPTDDVTHWCGNVLEAFALTVGDVAGCHDELDGEDVGSVADLVGTARRHPAAFPDPVTFVRDTLVASARGVDAPARYWANAPEVHLDALFVPFGCRVTVEWRRADTRRIVLEDADGTEFRATLTYPETPLGRDNYPALLDAVNRELLAGTGVELVLLDGPCERWQFALGERAALDKLRCRYGEAVQFGSRGLLAEHQPGEYVPAGGESASDGDDGSASGRTGDVPVPDWADASPDRLERDVSFRESGESFAALFRRIDRSTDSFADVDPEALRVGETEPAGETRPTEDVATLLEDLSDVWPPDIGGEPERNTSVETPVLGSSPDPLEEEMAAIDELFYRLERDVATHSRDNVDDAADKTQQTDPDATPETIAASTSDATAGPMPAAADDSTPDAADVSTPDGAAPNVASEFVWLDERRLRSKPGKR